MGEFSVLYKCPKCGYSTTEEVERCPKCGSLLRVVVASPYADYRFEYARLGEELERITTLEIGAEELEELEEAASRLSRVMEELASRSEQLFIRELKRKYGRYWRRARELHEELESIEEVEDRLAPAPLVKTERGRDGVVIGRVEAWPGSPVERPVGMVVLFSNPPDAGKYVLPADFEIRTSRSGKKYIKCFKWVYYDFYDELTRRKMELERELRDLELRALAEEHGVDGECIGLLMDLATRSTSAPQIFYKMYKDDDYYGACLRVLEAKRAGIDCCVIEELTDYMVTLPSVGDWIEVRGVPFSDRCVVLPSCSYSVEGVRALDARTEDGIRAVEGAVREELGSEAEDFLKTLRVADVKLYVPSVGPAEVVAAFFEPLVEMDVRRANLAIAKRWKEVVDRGERGSWLTVRDLWEAVEEGSPRGG